MKRLSISNTAAAAVVAFLFAGFVLPNGRWADWQSMPGQARDVGAGFDGSVFSVAPEGIVYRWNEDGFAWVSVGGQAQRVGVDSRGRAWVVTGDEKIYRLQGETWVNLPGKAIDVAGGPDGSVFAVGEAGAVYRWNEDSFSWANVGGDAKRIAVDAKGTPWVTTKDEKIYRLRGQTWQNMPGHARDIAAGAKGAVWAVSPKGKAYQWSEDGFNWSDMGGQDVEEITVGPNGDAWAVTKGNKIYWQPSGAAGDASDM